MSNWFKKLFGGSDHGSCEHCGHCDHCEEKETITPAPEMKTENAPAEDATKIQ